MKWILLLLVAVILAPAIASAEVVLNLTFDDTADCGNDSSGFSNDFDEQGTAHCIEDIDICKWYGCLNVTSTSNDYLNGTTNFELSDEMSISFWVNPLVTPTGSSSQAYYEIGAGDNYLYAEEGDYGVNTKWKAATGTVGGSCGESDETADGVWTHYVATYNGTKYILYKNAVIINNDDDAFGTLNYSGPGAAINVGKGVVGIDLIGYMDEFLIHNTTLYQDDVTALYDYRKAGTPPQLDLIVKNITIPEALDVMYDFSTSDNSINTTGTIPLNYVIENTGVTNNSADFNVTVYIAGVVVCHNTTSLNAGATEAFVCQLNKSESFIKGNITVDSNDDIDETAYTGGRETNNDYLIHYDMRAHPKIVSEINMSYVTTVASNPAYNAYNQHKSFVAEDFDSSWDASDVDPRGKKGYENAIGCYLNSYVSATQCARARNHLEGWLVNVTDWNDDDSSVQALHELEWVAKIYDLMFNNLTKAEAEIYSEGLQFACFEVYRKSNVRPDLDGDILSAGNGWGFGIGMAYPCLAVLGEVDNNPSSYYYVDDSTTGMSTPYYWLNRLDKHIAGNMNGSGFVEGVLYHQNYALYHTVGLLFYDQQTDIFQIADNRQGEICGRGRSMLYNYLDNTYNGATIRGDGDQEARFVSFGDSHSYDDIGEMEIVGASIITQIGVLCENQTVKDGLLAMRNTYYSYAGSGSDATRPIEDLYHYKTLVDEATAMTEAELASTFYYEFELAWEKFWLRDGYDYENDTVVMLDGGDKPGFGHPNAEFDLFVYALGEPFLDQPQVPNEDNTRNEKWHNTLSLSNTTVTGWDSSYTNPSMNQPYGGASDPATSTYPNGHYMPDGYRGSVTEHFGLPGLIGGAKAVQPYKGASPDPERKVLIYGDVIIDYYDVNRTTKGDIQFNWLNILDEFPATMSGTNLSFNRSGKDKNYRISVLNSSTVLTLEGGNSSFKASKEKEGSPNLDVWYGHYDHYTNATSSKTIFLHHWWDGTDTKTITRVTDADNIGVQIGADVFLILDMDGDGTTYGDVNTDGWSIIINASHVGSNGATYIGNATGNYTLPSTPFDGMIPVTTQQETPAGNSSCYGNRGIVCDLTGCSYNSTACNESSAARSGGLFCNLVGCS